MTEGTYPEIFDVCTPRRDVLDGTLQEDQFAASLATVAHSPDDVAPAYREASKFFHMTYPSDGLQTLLSNLSGRFLPGGGHDSGGYSSSILCLDTRFGGGKTHDLIASYHLATDPSDIGNLDRHLVDDAKNIGNAYLEAVNEGLSVDTSVFVGGQVDARNARSDWSDPDAPNTRTMWGEITYQLYGLDGYELIKEYDQDRTAPGGNTLMDLFDLSDGPALVLIDEIAAYLEAASAIEVGNATLASQTLSFVLSLLETASEVDNVTVVYSIADTAFEEEAEEVRTLIDELNQIGRRQHKTVTPTSENEVRQVLQHRLFEEIGRDQAGTVETDIYERLDARIGLFENVVGDMQPILSGVSGQIRSATLEADRDEGADAVERADQELSDKIEEQEQSDRVDVGESLDTVDEPVAQDVIDEEKLDAWQSKAHPDIADVGATDYEYTPPFFTESLEQVFVTNETLSENGIEFTAFDDLVIPETDTEGFELDDVTYHLQLNGVIETPPDLEDEGALAKKIAPQDVQLR